MEDFVKGFKGIKDGIAIIKVYCINLCKSCANIIVYTIHKAGSKIE